MNHRDNASVPHRPNHFPALPIVCGLVVLMAGCAHESTAPFATTAAASAPAPNRPTVPESLRIPDDQMLVVTARGAGFQIYRCRAGANPAAFGWALEGPEAQLHYVGGRELGRHYVGPTWEALDGSRVVGEVVAHDDGPDPTAVPLLLLRARETSGPGVFSSVQSIQRLHTVGGRAPTTGCDAGYAGTEARVAYSADYYFYAARP